ncbi:PcfK-like protein [Bacteroides thetaiotaomicron]|uniref:PcfK-like family protein n=1 Tax=Bacteroides thetaiotaomicron TaxID=818 RepID=UPI001C8C709A|nr:PcfK-like family protein [Bacteroides thetaiotaomicron]MBX9049651.1 PcfK-like protein [Bacteroides thetaiotaomicron]MBX9072923.1 PcfK-like protein [Bacteroides thetaiotaomicron]
MKATDHFKQTIQTYLEQRAEYDDLFAHAYRNPLKNLDDCVTYILNYVKNSGYAGFSDDEIFGQAVHYYDELDIEVGKPIDCKVVVNRTIELTEEEKAQARQRAIQKAQDEAYAKLTKRTKPSKTTVQQPQASLFDF